jgi:hypothetical protein
MPSASPLTICCRKTSSVVMTAPWGGPAPGSASPAPARGAGSPGYFSGATLTYLISPSRH